MKENIQLHKPRTLYFDVLRMLACFLVVLTHSAMPAVDLSHGPFYAFFSTLAAPSSELFLCISGAILLPVTKPMSDFYKVRFTKLIYPVIFWSFIVTFFFYFKGHYEINDAIKRILLIPFQPVHGIYWFVYAICGLYLIAPFISRWLVNSTKKEVELFLLFWGITQSMPLFNYFIPEFYDLNGSYYNMFSCFGGFIGYMILGFYLRKYPLNFGGIRRTLIVTLLVTILLLSIIFICKFNNLDTMLVTDNLSLFSAIAVANIFTLGQTLSKLNIVQNLALFFEDFAKYSFGIYLCHMITIQFIRMIFIDHRLHPVIETPLICILSLIFAYIVVRALSKLPYSNFTVGIKKNKE